MAIKIERRFIADELRINSAGGLEGYAAVFGQWADVGGFREKVRLGAFKKTIQEADVRFLINHNPDKICGRTTNETLRLKEDSHGLRYSVDLPDVSYARDLRKSVLRGDISQNSFGFRTILDKWSDDGKERELLECQLFDVSAVTFPAYEGSKITTARTMGRGSERIVRARAAVTQQMIQELLR